MLIPTKETLCILRLNFMDKKFIILDFGSQYTNLIGNNLNSLGYKFKIIAGDERFSNYQKDFDDLGGIILSGGAHSVYDGIIDFDKDWIESGLPVLGICFGHQLLASNDGGKVEKETAEFGKSTLNILQNDPIFEGVKNGSIIWMSHYDSVTKLPKDFINLASSDYSKITAFRKKDEKIYGLQFHPEVSHTEFGLKILENFCLLICGVKKGKPWTAKDFISEITTTIRSKAKVEKVIFGLSGGVDSMTMAALLRISLPRHQLLAVYVDTGLMPDETEDEVTKYCEDKDIPLLVTRQRNRFIEALKGITDPSTKGKVIGKHFIRVFEEIAELSGATIFAQGTIWSDVVESGITKFSSQIKPHHNVAGLPKKMKFILLEPLRQLFKDQVRSIAKELNLPDHVVNKKVFPGPGYAIRIQGEVTKEKVDIVKKSTKIIEDIIEKSDIRDQIWMAFSILVDVPSLGIKGDKRVENKHALVIRAVKSKNSMTAEFSPEIFPYLGEISKRITDEVGIGRVVYDITNKPPATIEWQ